MKAAKDMTTVEIKAEMDEVNAKIDAIEVELYDDEDGWTEEELWSRLNDLAEALRYRGEEDYERWPL